MIVEKIIYQPQRTRLPKKRHGFVREAYVGGHKVYVRTGEYEDGSLGEIFIDMYKEGASFRGLLNSFAILTSKALQYGIPLDELVDTFIFTRFDPSGVVMGHDAIRSATSILDYVFRSLGYDYLNRKDFVHVNAVDEMPQDKNGGKNGHYPLQMSDDKIDNTQEIPFDSQNSSPLSSESVKKMDAKEAKRFGYTGEQCEHCGSIRVRRNGSCTVCEDCGGTSGCS
jgi:ribonucleoside-diphosphate reductase alpha chain